MKIVVVLQASNCEKTLKDTIRDIPNIVNDIVLVDDCSNDGTYNVAQNLGLRTSLDML